MDHPLDHEEIRNASNVCRSSSSSCPIDSEESTCEELYIESETKDTMSNNYVLKRYKLVRSSLGPSRYGHLNCLDIKEKDGKLHFLQKSLQTLRIQNAYLFGIIEWD